MTISEMLARNARLYPDDSALVELRPGQGTRRETTWREFDNRANRVANMLADRGVGEGDRVVHVMMNSIAWLEVYFGIIRTGAWAVPLNYRFNAADIKYCVDISEAKAMVIGEEFTDRITEVRAGLPTVTDYLFSGQDLPDGMQDLEDALDESSVQPLDVPLGGDDTCGLYFTSGTTGDPKPIVLTHRNMEFAAMTEQRHHYQQREDNFILIPPLYHAGAKMHWFGSLLVGGRATILTEVSPQTIFSAIERERGTIAWLLVPWTQDILGALDRGELRISDYDLSSWRLMHIGAQPVPPSLVHRWKEYFPEMQYDTNYGLTEASGPGCVHLGIENEHKVGAIGRAGDGWQVRIVDDQSHAVTPGENGELLVQGDGVMKEYYKNPARTAEAIRDGWLYTGDVARTDDDGFIYLTDRKKDVVITGGENIYPVEVEDVIQGHPKVHDVAVIGIPDERLGEIAAAIIDPVPGETLTEEEVGRFCEERLPRYKRPRRIFFDHVPRNPTGKIEKPALRKKYGVQTQGT